MITIEDPRDGKRLIVMEHADIARLMRDGGVLRSDHTDDMITITPDGNWVLEQLKTRAFKSLEEVAAMVESGRNRPASDKPVGFSEFSTPIKQPDTEAAE